MLWPNLDQSGPGMPSYIEQLAEDEAANPEGRLARFRIDLPPEMVLRIDREPDQQLLGRSGVVKALLIDGWKYRMLNKRLIADRLQRRGRARRPPDGPEAA